MKAFGFNYPLKNQLEHVLGMSHDMKTTRDCLRLLIGPPSNVGGASLISKALYTQALVSYVRCFASGRRNFLRRTIFDSRPDLADIHDQFKGMRDRHISHSVDDSLEHVKILVAAEDETAPAQGLGVQFWHFMGDGPDGLRKFLTLVEFVVDYLDNEETRLGDELAQRVLGPDTTWKAAKRAFNESLQYNDPVYGPTMLGGPSEDDESTDTSLPQ
ncbi:hypothetical protein ACS0Y7_04535 [Burkholderia gladioli]|uniref:hypothetical protein n=1 Tax=Burkholderia gladioli TaxID=28095 RepID=UPI001C5CCD7B|nr:hypothetical protein [Burkholderia gladioli]MBW5284573.1 hypothetical protein [Burkholderia gladioli]